MVHPITCRVYLENACPFFKQFPRTIPSFPRSRQNPRPMWKVVKKKKKQHWESPLNSSNLNESNQSVFMFVFFFLVIWSVWWWLKQPISSKELRSVKPYGFSGCLAVSTSLLSVQGFKGLRLCTCFFLFFLFFYLLFFDGASALCTLTPH